MSGRTYFVYIAARRTCTLYVGVTNDLERRVFERKQMLVPGFTRRYGITRLVYYEGYDEVVEAMFSFLTERVKDLAEVIDLETYEEFWWPE